MLILVTGAWRCSEGDIKKIEALGNSVVFHEDERASLPIDAKSVEGVICNGLFLYHDIEKFVNLKFIQLTSAGLDRVPLDYIKEKGIALYNARGVYSSPMAEYALWGVLSLYKRAREFFEGQKEHSWKKIREIGELCGKCVLVVGCGSVGSECAVRFKAMGCTVIGIDANVRECLGFDKIFPVESLSDIIGSADVMILSLPYTNQTYHLFDSTLLKKMRRTAIIVNISRGAIIDTQSLVLSLNNGDIAGAVLDVFEQEPLDGTSCLWDMENVIITPHNSFVGEGNPNRLSKIVIENLTKFINR